MKKLMFLLMLVCLQTLCYSKPEFKKIESINNSSFIVFNNIDFYENQYFVRAQGDRHVILILDSSFLLKDSITTRQLIKFLEPDFNIDEKYGSVVIYNFAIDSSGQLWLATKFGVIVYDIAKKEFVKSYHYKNSILPDAPIFNIFIENETIVVYPNANEIYYFSDNNFTKVKFPVDTTMGEWTRLPYSNNAVLHQGKFYYLAGFSKNLIVFDGENFSKYDSGDYIVDKYSHLGHILKCYNGSVYFFEVLHRFNLIKFTDGEYSVTDFIKSGIFTIPDNSTLTFYNYEFDTTGNLWLGFQTYDTLTDNNEKYLLRYNSVTDFNLYKIEDLISGFNEGAFRISIIPETNEIFLCTNYSIYKTDLNTDVKETVENLPNLFLLDIFPNPARDKVMINFSTLPSLIPNLTVKIYNYLGSQINNLSYVLNYDSNTGLGTIEANVSGINWGLYLLVLDNGDNIKVKNIIIQK